jgi:hypothetical protein
MRRDIGICWRQLWQDFLRLVLLFTSVHGWAAVGDEQWDSTLSTQGVSIGFISAIAGQGTNLYVGGFFTSIGGVSATNIARWDGAHWQPLGTGLRGSSQNVVYSRVAALALNGTDLYAGGAFTNAGGVLVTNIARWDGSAWSTLGPGAGAYSLANYVTAITVLSNQVYVGGVFNNCGAIAAVNLARWTGSTWQSLTNTVPYDDSGTPAIATVNGLSGTVSTLLVHQGKLHAGGRFQALSEVLTTGSGFVSVHGTNVARWNGTKWEKLGTGGGLGNATAGVNALASDGTNFFAAGDFTNAGGVSANRIAKWDGASWSALGTGADKTVNALAWVNDTLFMGGSFTNAAGTGIVGLAQWKGSNWSALGSGLAPVASASVSALAVSATDLIIGGSFTQAGGRSAGSYGIWHTLLPLPIVFIQGGPLGLTLTATNAGSAFFWEQSDLLKPGSWTDVPAGQNQNPMILPAGVTGRFFRLRKN